MNKTVLLVLFALCATLLFQCSSKIEPLLTPEEFAELNNPSSSSEGQYGSSSSDDYGEPCGGYCQWPDVCSELRSDPEGRYNPDSQPMSCQDQIVNCGTKRYNDADCTIKWGTVSSSSSKGSSSSQSSSSVVPGPDPRPQSPEAMTSKTAIQYFADEGIKIGMNLGNALDALNGSNIAVEGAWGAPKTTQAPFDGFKNLGFNIVRIPVTWLGHIGSAPDYKLDEVWLRRVAEVVNYARTAELKAIINIMHDGHPDFNGWLDIKKAVASTADRDRIATQYQAVWKQIAEYFKNYGDWLMFEGFNEIQDGNWGTGTAAEYNIINDWNQRFTDAVRSTGGNNTKRYLIYNGYNTSSKIAETSSLFRLPTDATGNSGRQIVGFHFYEPWAFAGEASDPNWKTEAADKTNFNTTFSNMNNKFIKNGIQVIISENGPARYFKDPANFATAKAKRLAYIDYYYSKARENGLVPCYWDNGSFDPSYTEGDFTLINRATGLPNSEESRTVIEHMIAAVNNVTPPPTPSNTGNLGEYSYGYEDNRNQAVWVLSEANVAKAKAAGAKLVLKLSTPPSASLQFVWQDNDAESWWNMTKILGDVGDILNPSNATWNASTKTLTINIANAVATPNESELANPAQSFASATSLTFIIAYYLVGGSIDDLGIISADLVTE